MNHLDLFSGIGGFALGLQRAGFNTVGFCEIDPFCQKVLKKHWPDVPIYGDVRTITEDYDGETIELISGGYPCQPFSVAGKRKGSDDDRHLWPSMFDCVKKFRPRWVIGENVAGHINMGLDQVLSDLESEGYQCRAFVIPACAIDAPHRRDRVWIVGNAEHDGSLTATERRKPNKASHNNTKRPKQASEFKGTGEPRSNENVAYADTGQRNGTEQEICTRRYAVDNGCENVANASSKGLQGRQEVRDPRESGSQWDELFARLGECKTGKDWSIEPDVGRVANGIPNRVDRLRGLGNAVVPQIPEILGHAIMEASK